MKCPVCGRKYGTQLGLMNHLFVNHAWTRAEYIVWRERVEEAEGP